MVPQLIILGKKYQSPIGTHIRVWGFIKETEEMRCANRLLRHIRRGDQVRHYTRILRIHRSPRACRTADKHQSSLVDNCYYFLPPRKSLAPAARSNAGNSDIHSASHCTRHRQFIPIRCRTWDTGAKK